MKKIILIIFCLLLNIQVKALENIPNNIYYIDNGIVAYLNETVFEEFDENTKIYIEYRLSKDEEIKKIDLIEINHFPAKNILLSEEDEFYSQDIEIESRFVLFNEEYEYLPWSKKEQITTFSFEEVPLLKISDLDVNLNYKIDNEEEINDLFKEYAIVNDLKIEYTREYKFNDSEWENNKKYYDSNDVKVEVRVKYKVGKYESQYSNTLIYEKHPEQVCLFDSPICCEKIANISLCYWMLIIFAVVIATLIFFDHKKRMSREA